MNSTHNSNAANAQHYVVWFVSGADPDQLHVIEDTIQLQQDMLVVQATNDHDALEKAARLLHLRCECPAFVTKVMDRAELVRQLGILDQVDAGTLPPATERDSDHLVWFERYLVPTEPSADQRNLA